MPMFIKLIILMLSFSFLPFATANSIKSQQVAERKATMWIVNCDKPEPATHDVDAGLTFIQVRTCFVATSIERTGCFDFKGEVLCGSSNMHDNVSISEMQFSNTAVGLRKTNSEK